MGAPYIYDISCLRIKQKAYWGPEPLLRALKKTDFSYPWRESKCKSLAVQTMAQSLSQLHYYCYTRRVINVRMLVVVCFYTGCMVKFLLGYFSTDSEQYIKMHE